LVDGNVSTPPTAVFTRWGTAAESGCAIVRCRRRPQLIHRRRDDDTSTQPGVCPQTEGEAEGTRRWQCNSAKPLNGSLRARKHSVGPSCTLRVMRNVQDGERSYNQVRANSVMFAVSTSKRSRRTVLSPLRDGLMNERSVCSKRRSRPAPSRHPVLSSRGLPLAWLRTCTANALCTRASKLTVCDVAAF